MTWARVILVAHRCADEQHEGTGRQVAEPNSNAGGPASYARRFLFPASRIFGGLVWLIATLARSSPLGADRSYCRRGGGTPRPRVFRHAATGLQRPPEARLRVKPHFASAEKCGAVSGELMHKALRRRSPPTPPEPIPATPSRGRRGSREYEGGRGDGDNFANIKFLRRPAAGERISRRCEGAVTAHCGPDPPPHMSFVDPGPSGAVPRNRRRDVGSVCARTHSGFAFLFRVRRYPPTRNAGRCGCADRRQLEISRVEHNQHQQCHAI